jgi:small subunit ribosomal protein S28e
MAGKKPQKVKEVKGGPVRRLTTDEPVKAEVLKLVVRTGARGEITQVECKILEGKNKEKMMRRNVKGPVRIGDLLTLRETEIEARRAKGATKGVHV